MIKYSVFTAYTVNRAWVYGLMRQWYAELGVVFDGVLLIGGGESYRFTNACREWMRGVKGMAFVVDCDILVKPSQIEKACEEVSGGALASLAYNGLVVETANGNIKTLQGKGGAFVVDVEKYVSVCGGENPYMQGWGDDDLERWSRVEKFGRFSVGQGQALHITHPVCDIDHVNKENNLAEYMKVRDMTREQVKEYIKTWGKE